MDDTKNEAQLRSTRMYVKCVHKNYRCHSTQNLHQKFNYLQSSNSNNIQQVQIKKNNSEDQTEMEYNNTERQSSLLCAGAQQIYANHKYCNCKCCNVSSNSGKNVISKYRNRFLAKICCIGFNLTLGLSFIRMLAKDNLPLCKFISSMRASPHDIKHADKTLKSQKRIVNSQTKSTVFSPFVISLIRFFFISLCINTSFVGAQSWESVPKNSSAKIGNSVTLMCGVRDLGTRNVQWFQHNDDGSGTRVLFLNGEKWDLSVPERYSVSKHTSSGVGVDGYDVTLSNLIQADDKVYECVVQNMNDSKRQAKVSVLVSPGIPVITADKDLATLKEGDTIILTCSTTGGNPQPHIRWFRNGNEVSGGKVTPPSSKFGTTQSQLTRALTKDDHRAVFKCSAENEANTGQPVEGSLELSVQFAPVIDIGVFNPRRVIQGTEVKLLCNVEANPAVRPQDVQWLDKNDTPLGQGFEHIISSVQSNQGGKYTCRAENTVSVSKKILMLDVQYPPKVILVYSQGVVRNVNQLHVTEKQPLNMSCQVDANPVVDLNTIEWRKGAQLVHTGGYYYIPSVHRSNTGEYNCTAKNTLSPSGGDVQHHSGSASLQLFVQYPPGRATITVPPLLIKNENAELSCSVDDLGFPTAELQWSKLGSATIIHTGPKLLFQPLLLENTADYICTPTNEIGQGTPDSEKLTVLELPEWIGGVVSLPSKMETSINQTMSIQCEIRGNPQPHITWYKNDDIIDLSDGYFTVTELKDSIETHSWNITSVLEWKGFKRSPHDTSLLPEDTGKYRCHGISDIHNTGLQATTQLNVYYPPALDTTSTKVAVDVNQAATIHCRSHSLPETIFQWYNGSQQLVNGGRIQIKTEQINGEFPYSSTLIISNIQTHDFGVYKCKALNNQGSTVLDISLTVKSVPDPPKNLMVVSKTWESVQLSWEPGFDGGYPQAFLISYVSKTEKSDIINVGSTAHHNVTMLYPSTNYTFAVSGVNNLGSGGTSIPVYSATGYFSIDPPSNVQYDPNTYYVTFESPSTHYCARIDTFDGSTWNNYIPCGPTESGQIKMDEDIIVEALHMALCLQTRPDVCSDNITAVLVEQEKDLPTYVVIVIGVICAVIVITLLIVLICLCLRRRQAEKDEEETDKPTATVKPQPGNNGHVTTGVRPVTYDNPSLDKSHSPIDDRMNNVFTTESSHPSYDYYNGKSSNQLPNDGSNQQSYMYDNSTNIQREHSFKNNRDVPDGMYSIPNKVRHTSDKQYLHLDDPYKNQTKDAHNNSGEGSTSSDSNKQPKKVMYEVVV